MTYKETLDFLYSQLPMFTRVGAAAYKADVGNILKLCEALGNPHLTFKTIHVAGTNGKGSTSHTLASIFQTAGYKTGLFTSPHLVDFRERIRVNGKKISKQKVIDFVEKHAELIKKIEPSYFEMTVAMAFDFFASQKLDIAIIETGLGGRLDSTNIIKPELSVITNIGFDHTDLLGGTLGKIAYEKAGIIKSEIPVVIGTTLPETKPVFENKALESRSAIHLAAKNYAIINSHRKWQKDGYFSFLNYSNLKNGKKVAISTPLAGNYQAENMATVLTACDVMIEKGWKLPTMAIKKGIKNTILFTGLRGRFELKKINQKLVLFDTGHNEDGIKEVLQSIQELEFKKLHIVFGVVKDKNCDAVLRLLPTDANYYFCAAKIPRALPALELQLKADAFKLNGHAYSTVKKAYDTALKNAVKGDLIYVGGSTFVVGEALS